MIKACLDCNEFFDGHGNSKRCETCRKKARAAETRAYYKANREAALAHKKAYQEANREALAARKKVYREANLEAELARVRAWRKANSVGLAEGRRHRVRATLARESIVQLLLKEPDK